VRTTATSRVLRVAVLGETADNLPRGCCGGSVEDACVTCSTVACSFRVSVPDVLLPSG